MDSIPAHPHLAELYAALASELAWARDEHARLLRLSFADRIAAGVTWPSLRLHGVEQRRWLLVALRTASGAPLHEGITPGDLVTVAPVSSPDRGLSGRCVFAEGDLCEVRLDEVDALPGWLEGGHVAVTRAIDPSTTHRYQQALLRVDEHTSPLKQALLDASTPPPPSKSPSAVLRGLNAAQRRAAVAALGSPSLSLIHGPPGTGKTTLMVSLLQALSASGQRPWALADSNAAVDHLAVRAAAAGLEVLRLGSSYRIGEAAQPLTLDARAARSPLAPALRALDQEISRVDYRVRRTLYRQRRELLRQIRHQIIGECDVIASTLGTMVREAPELPPAGVALVDEATQAVEPAIWSVVPFVDRLILLGDPHQLGPVVKAPGNPLGRSLLSRLLDGGLDAPMLEEQYRMSAALCGLVSDTYGAVYRPHASVADRRLSDLPGVAGDPLVEEPLLWIDTAGGGLDEARDPVTRSLFNEGEAALVVQVVSRLLRAGVSRDNIGVIAPYSAQVARLRAALVDVEVATVNAFQGREKEVIICSFVRSNPSGELGFVADARRLVVAVTRAKRLLVCVGDSATLSTSSAFSDIMAAAQGVSASSWQSVWEPPWDAVLSP